VYIIPKEFGLGDRRPRIEDPNGEGRLYWRGDFLEGTATLSNLTAQDNSGAAHNVYTLVTTQNNAYYLIHYYFDTNNPGNRVAQPSRTPYILYVVPESQRDSFIPQLGNIQQHDAFWVWGFRNGDFGLTLSEEQGTISDDAQGQEASPNNEEECVQAETNCVFVESIGSGKQVDINVSGDSKNLYYFGDGFLGRFHINAPRSDDRIIIDGFPLEGTATLVGKKGIPVNATEYFLQAGDTPYYMYERDGMLIIYRTSGLGVMGQGTAIYIHNYQTGMLGITLPEQQSRVPIPYQFMSLTGTPIHIPKENSPTQYAGIDPLSGLIIGALLARLGSRFFGKGRRTHDHCTC
jgi:hypothetical protein